jgi:RNA polymerase sigma factor (sigma-70 family)
VFSRDPLRNPEPLIRRVYAYAAYRLGDGPDAEDATSETFERALRYRDSYDPSKGQPIAWLIGIARRCVNEGLARRQLIVPDPLDAPAPDDMEETIVRRVELAGAVARLEERERELIGLRYGADLTARQIAQLWGMQTNAVEVALHRALLRLRGILGEESESGRQPGETAGQ